MSGFREPASACDSLVLLGLQGLVLLMPLTLGGVQTSSQVLASVIIAVLLLLWLYKAAHLRTSSGNRGVRAPLMALLAFSALTIGQTIPLPPAVLATVSPQAYALFTELLPGWPGGGGWTSWRPLALEPFAAQVSLLAFAVPFGVFALIAAYPWGEGGGDPDARRVVFGRLVTTLLASAAVFAAAALIQRSAGGGNLSRFPGSLWGGDPFAHRAHIPYVNPNHLAGYLEMVIPLGALYLVSLGSRLGRRFGYSTEAATRSAIPRHRSWVAALVGVQRRLIAPLVVLVGLAVMLLAHHATDSRGGRAALGVAALICVFAMLRRAASQPGQAALRRACAAAFCAIAAGAVLVGQFMLEAGEETAAGRSAEPSLNARLALVSQARPLLRDFPVVGVGLGSWVHAFRLHQTAPIETGRWEYAHNDYLQLGVETGVAGALILIWFAWGVARAAGGSRDGGGGDLEAVEVPGPVRPRRRERSDWRAAMHDWRLLRIGLAAGVVALLVHGLSDFNLRIPANLLVFMTVLGLLVLSGPAGEENGHRCAWAPAALLVGIAFAAAGAVFGVAPFSVNGATSAAERISRADVLFASEGERRREEAVALARTAVELAPLDADAHEVLGRTLGDPVAGDASFRRAIRLSPDEALLRDLLALRLWHRGERSAALREFEASVAHAPYLAVHHYLAAGVGLDPTSPRAKLRALAARDSLPARLRLLDPAIRDAIERGLRRAVSHGRFAHRGVTVTDLATLLEASGRHGQAATVLEKWAAESPGDERSLRRAAADYLEAGEFSAAERVLIEQITRTPESGDLYRFLALKVYAAQDDFDTAGLVLAAGKRNSADLLPIYQGMRELLTLQQYRRPAPQVPVRSEKDVPLPEGATETLVARGGLS